MNIEINLHIMGFFEKAAEWFGAEKNQKDGLMEESGMNMSPEDRQEMLENQDRNNP